ncbi:MAG: enoyl-CoA hydratase-related protein, partial [Thermoplasmata archaeon]
MAEPATEALVRYERTGAIAGVVLNHPPVNVLSRELLSALSQRLEEATRDPEARVVVLSSGVERAFAAGANIREMAGLGPAGARQHGG